MPNKTISDSVPNGIGEKKSGMPVNEKTDYGVLM
jgi:hypothetical protein